MILYKGLKEPIDMLFGFIGKGLANMRDKMADGGGGGPQEIHYG